MCWRGSARAAVDARVVDRAWRGARSARDLGPSPCCIEDGRGVNGAGLGCGQRLLLSPALRLERGDLRVQAVDNLGGAGLGRGPGLLQLGALGLERGDPRAHAFDSLPRIGQRLFDLTEVRAQLLLLELARAKLWPYGADVVPGDAVDDQVDGRAQLRPRPRRRRAWRRRSRAVRQCRRDRVTEDVWPPCAAVRNLQPGAHLFHP